MSGCLNKKISTWCMIIIPGGRMLFHCSKTIVQNPGLVCAKINLSFINSDLSLIQKNWIVGKFEIINKF